MSIKLGVNIDHIATIREARGGIEPDPVFAAGVCLNNGADGITVHLREDRRHISDRDLKILRQIVQPHLNLEMAATEEMTKIALETKPEQATLVPEKREELTTEGGLDLIKHFDRIKEVTEKLQSNKIDVSYFIEPELEQLKTAKELKGKYIELHTGQYANATKEEFESEYEKLYIAAEYATKNGILVNAGHGLNYHNIIPICKLPGLREVNIGHTIISRAVFTGLDSAVYEMKKLLQLHG
jgi:pyridoxine 5-phosphate synthase